MKHLLPLLKYTWSFTMYFVTYMLIRNLFTSNAYLWWPYKHWIQDHTFETVIALAFIAFVMSLRCKQ